MKNQLDEQSHCASIVAHMFSMNIAGSYPPGGFAEAFMIAYQKADSWNRARMRPSFPVLVEYMDAVMNEPYETSMSKLRAGMSYGEKEGA